MSLCIYIFSLPEYYVACFSFRMVFFYLVTTRWRIIDLFVVVVRVVRCASSLYFDDG